MRIPALLRGTDFHFWLRYSKLFRLYEGLAHPKRIEEQDAEIAFYGRCFAELKTKSGLVFDVGANTGGKTEPFLALGMQVCAFEPASQSFRRLRARFSGNRRVILIQAAVSNRVGQATLHQYSPDSPYNTLSTEWKDALEAPASVSKHSLPGKFDSEYEVPTITIDAAIQKYGVPFYIKIDVEGHELEVLEGLTHSGWELLSFEANLPIFLPQTLDSVHLLAKRFPGVVFRFTGGHLQFSPEQWLNETEALNFIQTQAPTYFEVFVKKGE